MGVWRQNWSDKKSKSTMMSANIILHVQSGLIILIWVLFSLKSPFQEILVADDKSENMMNFALGALVGREDRFCGAFPQHPRHIWMWSCVLSIHIFLKRRLAFGIPISARASSIPAPPCMPITYLLTSTEVQKHSLALMLKELIWCRKKKPDTDFLTGLKVS